MAESRHLLLSQSADIGGARTFSTFSHFLLRTLTSLVSRKVVNGRLTLFHIVCSLQVAPQLMFWSKFQRQACSNCAYTWHISPTNRQPLIRGWRWSHCCPTPNLPCSYINILARTSSAHHSSWSRVSPMWANQGEHHNGFSLRRQDTCNVSAASPPYVGVRMHLFLKI